MIGYHNGNRERIRVMSAKGMSVHEIADDLQISPVTVRAHLRAIATRKRSYNSEQNRAQILALRAEGYTYRGIAAALGVSDGCVRHHLSKRD